MPIPRENPSSNSESFQRWQRQLQLSCHILCTNVERMKFICARKYKAYQHHSSSHPCHQKNGVISKASRRLAFDRWNTFVSIESSILSSMVPKDADAACFKYRNEIVEVTQAIESLLYRSSKSKSFYTNSVWVMTAIDRIARTLASEVLDSYSRSARCQMMRMKELQVRTEKKQIASAA
mmetsp:Transcript_9364/g.13876  ORF Transcript_9364/g.13876 Transcript_9364/m.13876 type:complete len:179 (+) Transcript_9364:164-700(+)